MSEELKPCPFCGGPVELERAHVRRDRFEGDRQFWGIVCRNTFNHGGSCCMEQVPSASPEAAIKRWNSRPDIDRIADLERQLAELRAQPTAQQIQDLFRRNCVNYAGNYEVTPGQALQIAKSIIAAHPKLRVEFTDQW